MRQAPGPAVALLPWADRFEDFYDKVGVSLEQFLREQTGGWLFNYVEALATQGVPTTIFFASARIRAPVRLRHGPTGARVCVLPSPRPHQKLRGARERFFADSTWSRSAESYLATPPRALSREIRRHGSTVLLCQEYEYPRFDVSVLIGRALRLPVFATFQGADRAASPLERPGRRLAIRSCAGLVVGARAERARLMTEYGLRSERIAAIPNPIDVRRWQPSDRAAARAVLGIPAGARVVVWHGRVQVHRKGLDVLLDAWQAVHAARPDTLLLMVGSGTDAEDLHRRLAALPDSGVRWVAEYLQDRDALWRHLAAADVSTLPSRHEGFPVAVIEAMAAGLPVVASDVPGVADILGGGADGGGLLMPVEDPRALAAAIGQLLDDEPRRRRLGALARRRVEQEFSLEVVGARLRRFLFDRQHAVAGR